jgi:hypothetical protein
VGRFDREAITEDLRFANLDAMLDALGAWRDPERYSPHSQHPRHGGRIRWDRCRLEEIKG